MGVGAETQQSSNLSEFMSAALVQEAALENYRSEAQRWQQQCGDLLQEHEDIMGLPAPAASLTAGPITSQGDTMVLE